MQENWVKDSGYSKNVAIFFGLMGVSIVLFVTFVVAINISTNPNPWLAIGFTLVAAVAASWLFGSLRCRNCGGRVAWWVARHTALGNWLNELLSLPACPICGRPGAASKAARGHH